MIRSDIHEVMSDVKFERSEFGNAIKLFSYKHTFYEDSHPIYEEVVTGWII